MTKFIMLVGISGCGKSTYSNGMKNDKNIILSSDAIRKELYGSEDIQDNPDKVFAIMKERTFEALSNNVSVIYDATNLNRKKRIAILNEIKKRLPKVFCECHIILDSPESCIKNQELRDRKVAEEVIYRQLKSFQVPYFILEDWDNIRVIQHGIHEIYKYVRDLDKIEQTSVYHKEDAYTHSIECERITNELSNSEDLKKIALYHDIGKAYTQTKNETGYHFYNHENVSAYLYLLCSYEENALYLAFLIEMHDKAYKKGKTWNKFPKEVQKLLTEFNKYDTMASVREEN